MISIYFPEINFDNILFNINIKIRKESVENEMGKTKIQKI